MTGHILRSSAALCAAALLYAMPARAEKSDPCGAFKDQLTSCRQDIMSCRSSTDRDARLLDQCTNESQRLTQALALTRTALSSAQMNETSLCEQVGDVARAALLHTPVPDSVQSCISSDQRAMLKAASASYGPVLAHLRALRDFEDGVTDRVPVFARTNADSDIEPLVADLGPPRTYRRLLISALERIAPKFWRWLRAHNDAAINEWFASVQPLDASLVQEAQSNPAVPVANTSPLSAALPAAAKSVQVYVELAGCSTNPEHKPTGDCVRAMQLQDLLETSGPLVLRRRQQTVWETECTAITGPTLVGWLSEFSAIQEGIHDADRNALYETVMTKMYACYLGDAETRKPFQSWFDARVPRAAALSGSGLQRLDRLRARSGVGDAMDLCLRAAVALKHVAPPTACEAPQSLVEPLDAWLRVWPKARESHDMALGMCAQFTQLLWEGRRPFIPTSFARSPTNSDLVRIDESASPQALAHLRQMCAERRGMRADFPGRVAVLGDLAARFGESVDAAPWRLDPNSRAPLERGAYSRAASLQGWVRSLAERQDACDALGLQEGRCAQCGNTDDGIYDCALLASVRDGWERWRQQSLIAVVFIVTFLAVAEWSRRTFLAVRYLGPWWNDTRSTMSNIGLQVLPDRRRWLMPSRWQIMHVRLPATPAWARWGQRAVILRTNVPSRIEESDINRASAEARQANCDLAFLTHEGTASPQLAAIRAMLEWASKGAKKAVHVLPVSFDRLHWARGTDDLLELVDQASSRGNPFEVRGRLTSSSQFFNRERLVSGLLASTQAGQWQVVTGLRRYGKSSLALEVARRLPGPSAYVDLTGFFQPIALSGDGAAASNAVLKYLCSRLYESAALHYPAHADSLPKVPPTEGASLTVVLADWYGSFVRACLAASPHRTSPMLLILDEIEQVLTGRTEQLRQELDAFSAIVGGLRSIFGDPLTSQGGARVGVMFCSALHPFLWAPMGTLASQSLMGAFQSAYLPRLSDEAVVAMMRSLGAPQGIRFSDAAIELITHESQGIPLLVRRLGASVLELYDVERAREGTLGAVDIGIEGASAAIRREEEVGSVLRGWVESEIADPREPGGQVLRWAVPQKRITAAAIRDYAAEIIGAQLQAVGLGEILSQHECTRRSQEAASKVVEALCEAGLLTPEGDQLKPVAYAPTDGLVRRILLSQRSGS